MMSRVSVALKACATSVLLLAAPMLAGNAAAQTVGTSPATTTFKVTATVVKDCVVSATDLGFGNVGVVKANVDATSSITVECSPGTAFTVFLGAGTGAGATHASRKMTGPNAATMNYSLYTTSARTTVWTATAASGAVGSGTTDASGTPISLTVFGRLFPQTVATGSYQDTITVSVSY